MMDLRSQRKNSLRLWLKKEKRAIKSVRKRKKRSKFNLKLKLSMKRRN